MVHARADKELADALAAARTAAVKTRTRVMLAAESGAATQDEVDEASAVITSVEALIARGNSALVLAEVADG